MYIIVILGHDLPLKFFRVVSVEALGETSFIVIVIENSIQALLSNLIIFQLFCWFYWNVKVLQPSLFRMLSGLSRLPCLSFQLIRELLSSFPRIVLGGFPWCTICLSPQMITLLIVITDGGSRLVHNFYAGFLTWVQLKCLNIIVSTHRFIGLDSIRIILVVFLLK